MKAFTYKAVMSSSSRVLYCGYGFSDSHGVSLVFHPSVSACPAIAFFLTRYYEGSWLCDACGIYLCVCIFRNVRLKGCLLLCGFSLNWLLHRWCIHEQRVFFPGCGDVECYGACMSERDVLCLCFLSCSFWFWTLPAMWGMQRKCKSQGHRD